MTLAKNGIPSDVIIEVLRQRHRPYSAAKRRELLDSISTRAIQNPGLALRFTSTISQAGDADPTISGQPEPSALDQLIRIHKATTNKDARFAAADGLLRQVSPSRAFPYLRELATSHNEQDAFLAVGLLGGFANSSSTAAPDRQQAATLLQDLLNKNLVTANTTAVQLCQVAQYQKWDTHGRCTGIM